MLKGTINDSIGSVTIASSDLNTVASLPSIGSDSVSGRLIESYDVHVYMGNINCKKSAHVLVMYLPT